MNYPISNFAVVQIAPKPQTQPGVIPKAELEAYIGMGSQTIVDPVQVDSALQAIQAQLQLAVDRGQNNDRIGLENFDIQAYANKTDSRGNPVPMSPLLAFRCKANQRWHVGVGSYPPPGFPSDNYHYATAQTLINVASMG